MVIKQENEKKARNRIEKALKKLNRKLMILENLNELEWRVTYEEKNKIKVVRVLKENIYEKIRYI